MRTAQLRERHLQHGGRSKSKHRHINSTASPSDATIDWLVSSRTDSPAAASSDDGHVKSWTHFFIRQHVKSWTHFFMNRQRRQL
jgi:hypothetical protein